MNKTLRSGQLAQAAGVNVQTLRYYERRGLLPDPQRSLGGHREYGPEAVTTLRVIRGLARLGFTLEEIAELIEVGAHHGPRPGLRAAAAAKLTEVERKITNLQQVRTTLTGVLTADCTDLTRVLLQPRLSDPVRRHRS